jgi:hypothetical protein
MFFSRRALKRSLVGSVEVYKSLVNVAGKSSWGRTQTTSSFVSTRLCSRMALSTAEPSLPVALVRAIMFE